MTPRTQLWTIALLAAVAGCAALTPERPAEQDAQLRLDRGLAALQAGRYARAFDDLAWVYSRCHGREAGTHALLGMAALELDPRNRAGRPDMAVELLGRTIQDPGTPAFARPLAESAYLTGLALGAPEPGDVEAAAPAGRAVSGARDTAAADTARAAAAPVRARPVPRPPVAEAPATEMVYGCGAVVEVAEEWAAPALPALPGPSLAAMLAGAEAERDALAVEADTLREQLTAVRAQLQETREELERIRKTLRP